MKSIYISGNAPLYGEVTIQGSKNAALPIMAAALLIPGISVLKNCPRIADVEYMCRLLQSIGCFVERDKNEVRIGSQQEPAAGGICNDDALVRHADGAHAGKNR